MMSGQHDQEASDVIEKTPHQLYIGTPAIKSSIKTAPPPPPPAWMDGSSFYDQGL